MTVKRFKACDDSLDEVNLFLEEFLEEQESLPRPAMQLSVAVEEIFVNIAHYAYGSEVGEMELAVGMSGDKAVLRFTDWGVPFDPMKKEDPDVTLSASERSIGGLGIFMVKKTMDEVTYRYEEGKNILSIVKKIR